MQPADDDDGFNEIEHHRINIELEKIFLSNRILSFSKKMPINVIIADLSDQYRECASTYFYLSNDLNKFI